VSTATSLISVADAQRIVLEHAKQLDPERVPIERAAGRVLAEPVAALVDLPPFANSAMDGFALRSADTAAAPLRLPVVAEIAAGSPAERPLAPGEAMGISTGAALPEGADAVVPLELVEEGDGSIELSGSVAKGDNVREPATDVSAGDTLLDAGTRLGPAQVAALAAAGLSEVQCTKRPRVGILVTGSELRQPGEPLGPGQIYESNGLLLATALQLAGAVPAQLGVVADDADEHERAMERALLGFDMLVTSGGASVGPHDLVRSTQGKLRVEVLVTFELFVRPAVKALLGLPDPLPELREGTLAAAVVRNLHRDEYVRATTRRDDESVVVVPLRGRESHMIARAGRADALIVVEAGEGELAEGEVVRYIPLG
jgi:molybdopterin molybdotransferase